MTPTLDDVAACINQPITVKRDGHSLQWIATADKQTAFGPTIEIAVASLASQILVAGISRATRLAGQ